VSPLPGPFARLQAGRRAAQLYREGVKLYDQHDLLGSEQLLRESFEIARAAGDIGQTAKSADPLSEVLWRKRRWADCAAVVEVKVECHRRLEGLDGDLTFQWRDELIWLYGKIDRFSDAEMLAWERVQAIRRRFPQPGAFHSFGLVTLAWTLRRQGRVDEAEPLCREALEIVEKIAGADDPRCDGRTLAWRRSPRLVATWTPPPTMSTAPGTTGIAWGGSTCRGGRATS
jgi:hypothetical protein